MSNLYEQNTKKEAEYCERRDKLSNQFATAANSGKKEAKAYQYEFLEAFNKEHKVFVSFKTNTNVSQKDYDIHYKKLDQILSKYSEIFSSKFNQNISLFHISRDEALKHMNTVREKLIAIREDINKYNQEYRKKHGFNDNYNAVRISKEITARIQQVQDDFYRIPTTSDYADYVNKIYGYVSSYQTRCEKIKSGSTINFDKNDNLIKLKDEDYGPGSGK